METELAKIEQRAARIAAILETHAETLRDYEQLSSYSITDIENSLENILNTRQLRRLSYDMYETE